MPMHPYFATFSWPGRIILIAGSLAGIVVVGAARYYYFEALSVVPAPLLGLLAGGGGMLIAWPFALLFRTKK